MAEEKKYTLLESFFILLGAPLVVLPTLALLAIVCFPLAMLMAWIRWTLWGWFAVPFLHAPEVPYWAMVGLGLLVASFMPNSQPTKDDPSAKQIFSSLSVWVCVHLIGLGIGYIIHIRM